MTRLIRTPDGWASLGRLGRVLRVSEYTSVLMSENDDHERNDFNRNGFQNLFEVLERNNSFDFWSFLYHFRFALFFQGSSFLNRKFYFFESLWPERNFEDFKFFKNI